MKFGVQSFAIVPLFAVLGCSAGSGSSDNGAPSSTAPPTQSQYTPGCTTAPACGTCGTCIEQCYCVEQNIATCANTCGGSAPSGTGGASSTAPTSTTTPPTGTTTPPTGTTTPPTGTTTPPTGTTTPPTGTTTPPTTPPATNQLEITTTPFDVAAGAEAFKCQNFQNRLGQNIAIVKGQSFMSPGSHHMFVFHDPSFDADTNSVADCSGTEFHDYLLLAQTPQEVETYPAGVGRSLQSTEGLRVLMHYLNTGSSTLSAQVDAKFDYVDPSAVTYLASQLFFNQTLLAVPPGTSTQSRTFTTPYDISLIYSISHMHKRGTHFHAGTNTGQVIYDGTEWDEPQPNLFDPPMQIAGNSTITWACDYNNTTGMTLTFGESATANEMCILVGLFYTTQAGAPQGQSLNELL